MGVNIGDIIPKREIELGDLAGRRIAVDAYNWIYQFLSVIRDYRTGQPLKDSKGRTTSHLSGIFYRSAKLLEHGISLCYVFDGESPELKLETTLERAKIRREARRKWKKALKEEKIEEVRKYAQQASKVTDQIIEGSKELLDAMGIPWVQAPGEGEAQAVRIVKNGEAYALGSNDYDGILLAAPRLVRNLNITGKRKLPGKEVYITIKPELIEFEEVLNELKITQEQLVDIGILTGTDYNNGIKNIGPKTALKLISQYGNIEQILKEKGYEFKVLYQQVRKIFLEPKVTEEYKLEWREPDKEKLMEFLCDEHDFSSKRVESAVDKMVKAFKSQQQSLSRWT